MTHIAVMISWEYNADLARVILQAAVRGAVIVLHHCSYVADWQRSSLPAPSCLTVGAADLCAWIRRGRTSVACKADSAQFARNRARFLAIGPVSAQA
jgi:hypothetical protein